MTRRASTRSPSTDRLARVASIYGDAEQHGRAPTAAVAVELGVNRRTAGRLVAAARDVGRLPRIDEPRRHVAATAIVYRGTPRQREWQVCGECLTAWPCALWRTRT